MVDRYFRHWVDCFESYEGVDEYVFWDLFAVLIPSNLFLLFLRSLFHEQVFC